MNRYEYLSSSSTCQLDTCKLFNNDFSVRELLANSQTLGLLEPDPPQTYQPLVSEVAQEKSTTAGERHDKESPLQGPLNLLHCH